MQPVGRAALMQHAPTLQREKTLRWLNCLVVASLAAGSARAFRTWHQLEGSLAGRATYAFDAAPRCDARTLGEQHCANPQDLIRGELRLQLASRGYSETAANDAHLLLSFSADSRYERMTLGERAQRAMSPAAVMAPASLAVHLVDPRSRVVLWRGWGDGVLGAYAERDERIAEAVQRTMAALPAARP